MNGVKKFISVLLALIIIVSCAGVTAEEGSWICAECGKENTTKFCTKCGAKKPEGIVCPGCGMNYPADTDAVFCGECGTKLQQEPEADSSFRYEGDGFDTPEEAVLYYLAGIRNLDLEQTLSSYAWETQVEHYDFKYSITRMKGIDPVMVPGMPVVNDLTRSANIEQIRSTQANYICRAIESYINDEILLSKIGSVVFGEDNEFDDYVNRCDNGRIEKLAEMRNIRIYTPDDVTEGKFSNEKIQAIFLRQNAIYGADETRNVFVASDIDGDTYAVAPTAAKYGDRWYIVNSGSTITNILGMETNRMAFFPLPDELKDQLSGVIPVLLVEALPEYKGTGINYEGAGFDSPEEAVNCYFEGLKNDNIQQMLKAFAWETQVSHYSLKDYAAWVRSINLYSPIRMNIDNPLMRGINLNSLRYYQVRRIYSSIRQYLLEDEDNCKGLLDGYRIDLKEEEEVDTFIQAFRNQKAENLETLRNIYMIDPEKVIERYNNDSVGKRLNYLEKLYGADEIKEKLAAAYVDGEALIFNPVLARYGDKWYIVTVEGIAFSILAIRNEYHALLPVKGSAGLEVLLQLLQQ